MTVNDFQVVVLAAGRGSRMTELTAGRPKCLLPVGGKPMLYHSLKVLENIGFEDVIILVLEASYSQVQNALTQLNLKLNADVVSLPPDHSEEWGTADSIRFLVTQEKIKTDVVLISCDLFTDASLHELLHTYRKHKASFSALFFSPMVDKFQIQIPGVKSKHRPEKDIIGIDTETSRLVFLASASDFEEQVKISRSILRRHPKLSLRTDLVDGHVYVLSHKLAKYLAAETSFGTLKGEFFPYVVGKQHMRPTVSNDESSLINESTKKSLFEFVKESKLEEDIRDLSTYTDHKGDLKKVYHGDILRCYAVVADPKYFGIRINSLQALCQANRICVNVESKNGETRIDSSAQIESNQIDSESFVGGGTVIKEKTSIKSTVIGENCIVHPKTRISRCIILKGVEINEGCVLDNCVVCDDAKIGKNCDLKNCIVGAYFTVQNETKANAQVLSKFEELMEI